MCKGEAGCEARKHHRWSSRTRRVTRRGAEVVTIVINPLSKTLSDIIKLPKLPNLAAHVSQV